MNALFSIDPKNTSICRIFNLTLAIVAVYAGLPLLRADRDVRGNFLYVVQQETETEVAEIAQGMDDQLTVSALPFVAAMNEVLTAQKQRKYLERKY